MTAMGRSPSRTLTATDGIQTANIYNSAGSLSQVKTTYTDGSKSYLSYNTGGYASVLADVNAQGVTTATQYTKADGSSVGKDFAAGVTLTSQAGNDTFTSFYNDTFVFNGAYGQDSITNFHTGSGSLHDVLQIAKSGRVGFQSSQHDPKRRRYHNHGFAEQYDHAEKRGNLKPDCKRLQVCLKPPRVCRRSPTPERDGAMTSKTTNKFSPEVRARVNRMVLDHAKDHACRWAAVVSIAEKIGCAAQTL